MMLAGMVAASQTPSVAQQPTPEQEEPAFEPTADQRVAIEEFSEAGILEGTSCSPEDCGDTFPRWQVAVWVIRFLKEETAAHETFADVDSDLWYAPYVETLDDIRVTHGCEVDPMRFCPDRLTTRGEMSAFTTRAFDLASESLFRVPVDVPDRYVFFMDIGAVIGAGIAQPGCSAGADSFCPDSPIRAAQAVEWLHKAWVLRDRGGSDDSGDDGDTRGGDTGNGGGGNIGTGGGSNIGTGGGGGNIVPGGGGNIVPGGGGNIVPGGNGEGPGNTGGGSPAESGLGPSSSSVDVGPNGECTHHDHHYVAPGNDRKSYLISEDGTYYAHWHDHNEWPHEAVRWIYWPGQDNQPPKDVTYLSENGDLALRVPAPCTHITPRHDHGSGGSDRVEIEINDVVHGHQHEYETDRETIIWDRADHGNDAKRFIASHICSHMHPGSDLASNYTIEVRLVDDNNNSMIEPVTYTHAHGASGAHDGRSAGWTPDGENGVHAPCYHEPY